MITVNNLSLQFGKRVLYKDVNLKFTPATATASLAQTVLESPPSSSSSQEISNQRAALWTSRQVSASPF